MLQLVRLIRSYYGLFAWRTIEKLTFPLRSLERFDGAFILHALCDPRHHDIDELCLGGFRRFHGGIFALVCRLGTQKLQGSAHSGSRRHVVFPLYPPPLRPRSEVLRTAFQKRFPPVREAPVRDAPSSAVMVP